MGKSLQEQLLKAGLVDKKEAKKAQKAKRKNDKLQHKSKSVTVDESRLLAKQAMVDKAEKDRQLNKQREEVIERKSIAAQIRQLIEMNRQEKGEGDVVFNFVDNKKIKKMFLSKELQDQLARGCLAIVRLDKKYELVPSVVAEKIRTRDEDIVILMNEQVNDEENDPYADYKIPDDLMW